MDLSITKYRIKEGQTYPTMLERRACTNGARGRLYLPLSGKDCNNCFFLSTTFHHLLSPLRVQIPEKNHIDFTGNLWYNST